MLKWQQTPGSWLIPKVLLKWKNYEMEVCLKSNVSKRMKTISSILYTFCVALITINTQSCSDEKHQTESHASAQKYTCPMHPQVIQDAPGTCPICAMDLVPVSAGRNKGELVLSESQIQLANIKT